MDVVQPVGLKDFVEMELSNPASDSNVMMETPLLEMDATKFVNRKSAEMAESMTENNVMMATLLMEMIARPNANLSQRW